MSGGQNWRPYRFAPLAQLTDTAAWQAGVPAHMSAQMQASMAEGFQRGMERGYREGHESGHRAGLEAGRAEGLALGTTEGSEKAYRDVRAQFASLAAPIDSMLDAVAKLREDYQAALRKEVVDLLARVAREVIRCELALQPGQLVRLVDETLATLPRAVDGDIEVVLNDKDLERIREIDPQCAARWNLLGDARLESGECRIRTGEREIDAGCRQRLAACLDQVSSQLMPEDVSAEGAAA